MKIQIGDEVMINLEKFMELTEIEKIMKSFYKEKQNSFTGSQKSVDLLQELFFSRNISIPPEISMNNEILDSNYSFSVYRQYRYFPSISHSHINFEIYFVLNGSGVFISNGQEVTVNQGNMILVAPGIMHSLIINTDDTVIINMFVCVDSLENVILANTTEDQFMLRTFAYLAHKNISSGSLIFHFENGNYINEIVLKIYDEWIEELSYKKNMLNLLLMTFFIVLIREYDKEIVIPVFKNKNTDEIIIDVLNTIRKDYVELTLDKLSSKFNYSSRQMSRILKEYTGKSFKILVGELRLKKAQQLLQQNEISIEEVAIQTGFSEISHFYHAFKRYMKCTPKEYRSGYIG
ncbi:AraC family transcriptional regulator [Clostridium sp. SHJSY1]|uniref:AraC family transcriptional regulator n=1 Tax=Clostridium sp. SHJSY1 TaxID=2942483 RepID=UPI002875E468|nr:AraC family transcriptional regulator [Clostridium sp. SHJSY1]MDS0526696.1 AraC family transcriptional regulator [Clostridium sp. SHJSY1]